MMSSIAKPWKLFTVLGAATYENMSLTLAKPANFSRSTRACRQVSTIAPVGLFVAFVVVKRRVEEELSSLFGLVRRAGL